MWDADKAVLRGKLIVLNAYIRKEEKLNTSDLSVHHNYLGIKSKQQQTSETKKRRKEIIKIRAEINEIAKKCTLETINKVKYSQKKEEENFKIPNKTDQDKKKRHKSLWVLKIPLLLIGVLPQILQTSHKSNMRILP